MVDDLAAARDHAVPNDLVVLVQQSGHVGEQHELLGLHDLGNLAGNQIGVDVVRVAVGTDTATLGLTETRLGLIPATIGPYVVARMGQGRARRVFMSARLFDAEDQEWRDGLSPEI